MTGVPVRRAARLIVVDAEGSILLVRYRDHRDGGGRFWATPGGGIEAGEAPEAAAARELREETGLHAPVGPPLWRLSFEWDSPGGRVRQEESYFLVRVPGAAPEVRNGSPEPIEEHRWWRRSELERTSELVYPQDLVQRLESAVDHRSGGGSMRVRPIALADRDDWVRMRAALWPEASPAELADECDAFLAGAAPEAPEPDAVLVCEDSPGRLQGFIELSVRSYAEGCTGATPFVEAWFVEAPARGRGVGRALLDAAEAWARARGFREMGSDTTLENEGSQRAHRALGFEEVERVVQYRKALDPVREPARLATRADVPALLALMHDFYAEAGFALDPAPARAAFETLLANPAYGAAWLLLDGGVPAGYLVLTLRFGMEHGGLEGYVDDLFVRAESRRRGLARAGLDALFAECRRRGARAVNVTVGQENDVALALYRSFGLVPPTDGRQTLTVLTP